MVSERTVRLWFKVNNITPKHDFKKLQFAFNSVASELDASVEMSDLMDFVFLNRPIGAIHTHSYGFHTATGRAILEQFKHFYYNVVHPGDDSTRTDLYINGVINKKV